MDKHICKICNEEVTVNNHYWKAHKIKEADYYQKYVPRYSKLTGELLKFKNRDFYLNNDFQDKNEMMEWFRDNAIEAKAYALELLVNRIEKKKLIYAPSQVELRSLMMPSIIWYKKNLFSPEGNPQSYNSLCELMGLKVRFDKEDEIIGYSDFPQSAKILIDTREQAPLRFPNTQTETCKLDYGDYARSPNRYKVHVERKSLSDFVSTLGVGFDRFCREVQRAKKEGAYLIVLVESPLNSALSFNFLPHMRFATKSSPEYVFNRVRAMMQKYPNLQFLFSKGRLEAAELIKKIFSVKKHVRHYDLQYMYDIKAL